MLGERMWANPPDQRAHLFHHLMVLRHRHVRLPWKGMGLILLRYLIPRPIVSIRRGVLCQVYPRVLSIQKDGSQNPETWLSQSGMVAQFASNYLSPQIGFLVGQA